MTIDHLSVDHVVHVIQEFTDARGVAQDVGEQGLITSLTFNQKTNEIAMMRWIASGHSPAHQGSTRRKNSSRRSCTQQIVEATTASAQQAEHDLLELDRKLGRVTP